MSADLFSIVALIIAAVSPLGVGWYSHHLRRKDVEEERERAKEEESRRAEVAAEALKIAQDLLNDSRKLNQETKDRVSEITSMFPNGHLTAALQRELATSQAALSAMKDVVKIKEINEIPVFPQTYESIKTMEVQVRVLTDHLKERLPRV